MSKSERDYRDEDDHRTMTRAAEIQSDKTRMAGVQRHHRKLQKSLKVVGRSITRSRR
jgi:hypothetical protein